MPLSHRQTNKLASLKRFGAEQVGDNVLPPKRDVFADGRRTYRLHEGLDPIPVKCPICTHILQPLHDALVHHWCPDCHMGINTARR